MKNLGFETAQSRRAEIHNGRAALASHAPYGHMLTQADFQADPSGHKLTTSKRTQADNPAKRADLFERTQADTS